MKDLALSLPLGACLSCITGLAQQLPPAPVTEAPLAKARTLTEIPAPKPPQINCSNGQLSIVAENSSISSILDKLRPCIGVDMRMPTSYADERIFVHLGPGPQRDILDSLLSSTELNYIIESSNSAPVKIVSVSLTLRTTASAEGDGRPTLPSADLALTPARRAWREALETVRHGGTVDGDAIRAASEDTPPSAMEAIAPVESKDLAGKAPVAPPAQAPPEANIGHIAVPDAALSSGSAPDGLPAAGSQGAQATAGTPATPVAPQNATADAQADPAGGPILQKQINQMQHMFEERKKMITGPGASAPSQP